ncbi:MAG: tyrosine-type recombinase/integrase [Anaerolineaceae bacterium]|nr:tyrosine-type recombinase/integrase [Anaerolineaceae bacterium]
MRNYVSDLQHFMAWCETLWSESQDTVQPFALEQVATPTLTRYRDHLQHDRQLQPATINRHLVSLKRYFGWAVEHQLTARNPASVVKLVPQMARPAHHLTDHEEAALVAAAEHAGSLRDRTLIVLMLHTGLRVNEVCSLKRDHLVLHKRSGYLKVWGKRNKYREVPLNATARKALEDYRAAQPESAPFLFVSQRTGEQLTPRGVGFLIKKYAQKAGLPNLRPHDLRHRFGYRMAETVPMHRLAQIMGHDSLDTTMIYIRGTEHDLQQAVEQIAWE